MSTAGAEAAASIARGAWPTSPRQRVVCLRTPATCVCFCGPQVLPEETDAPEGAEAVDTPFGECTEDECNVVVDGDVVQLQRINVDIPAGAGLTGAFAGPFRLCHCRSTARAHHQHTRSVSVSRPASRDCYLREMRILCNDGLYDRSPRL